MKAREQEGRRDTARLLAKIPEVGEVRAISGDYSYFVKLRAENPRDLAAILRRKIRTIPSVQSTRTTIALGTIKETSVVAFGGDVD